MEKIWKNTFWNHVILGDSSFRQAQISQSWHWKKLPLNILNGSWRWSRTKGDVSLVRRALYNCSVQCKEMSKKKALCKNMQKWKRDWRLSRKANTPCHCSRNGGSRVNHVVSETLRKGKHALQSTKPSDSMLPAALNLLDFRIDSWQQLKARSDQRTDSASYWVIPQL